MTKYDKQGELALPLTRAPHLLKDYAEGTCRLRPDQLLQPQQQRPPSLQQREQQQQQQSSHSTASHSTASHSTASHSTAYHSTAYHSTAYHSTASHTKASHSTASHSTASHSTASHSSVETRNYQEPNHSVERPSLERIDGVIGRNLEEISKPIIVAETRSRTLTSSASTKQLDEITENIRLKTETLITDSSSEQGSGVEDGYRHQLWERFENMETELRLMALRQTRLANHCSSVNVVDEEVVGNIAEINEFIADNL